jgi:hypothetical protein
MSEKDIGEEIKKTEEILRIRGGATGSKGCRSGLGSLPLMMAILSSWGDRRRLLPLTTA